MPSDLEAEAIANVICAAREVQTFLWGHANGSWGLEEWLRMFRKRVAKLDEVKRDNPHAEVELQKRLLQTAALAVALMAIIRRRGVPWDATEKIESNLPQYAEPIASTDEPQMLGAWICDRCKFVLQKSRLHAKDDSISADIADHCEGCPNDGEPMRPLTWREANESLFERAIDGSKRLNKIAEIIEGIEQRAMAVDGPVSKTSEEITEDELKRIYRLAKG